MPPMTAPPPLPPGIAPEDLESSQYDDGDSEGSTSESGGEEEEYDPAVPLERLEGDADDGQPLGDRRISRDEEMEDSEGGKGFGYKLLGSISAVFSSPVFDPPAGSFPEQRLVIEGLSSLTNCLT